MEVYADYKGVAWYRKICMFLREFRDVHLRLEDVFIEVTSPVYIERQEIVAVPQLKGQSEADNATITTNVLVFNTSPETCEGRLPTRVIDEKGNNKS